MKTYIKTLFFTFSLFYLAACSTMPDEPQVVTNIQWDAHSSTLTRINDFQATGKLAYRSPDNKTSLSFNWKHSAGKSELRLLNFLGQTVLTMTMTDEGAVIVDNDDETYSHQDPNILLARLTGLIFPVSQMKDWIKGLPTEADSYQLSDSNLLQSLTKNTGQSTWQATYTSYQDVRGIPLPKQVNLKQEEITLKIVISKWVTSS